MLTALQGLYPELIVCTAAIVVLIADILMPVKRPLVWVAGAGLLAAFWATTRQYDPMVNLVLFDRMVVVDSLTHFFRSLVLVGSGLVLGMSASFPGIPDRRRGAFYAMLLFATLSMMLMAMSNDLLMLFLTIEFLGIASYILVGFTRDQLVSSEGAVKYFLVGAFSSAIMLYGMTLLYGLAHSTNLYDLSEWYRGYSGGPNAALLTAAIFFVLVGFGFKIAMVPFHMWVPDVYQGAPTPVTAFLAVASKAVGMAVLLRTFLVGLPAPVGVLAVLAAVTMTVGNLLAIPQRNVKRLLAYSSIGHVGYVLMGFVASQAAARAMGGYGNGALAADLGLQGVLVYLAGYLVMNIGAFTVVMAVANRTSGEDIEHFSGLSQRDPALAYLMTLFLLSLAGIPPTVGFLAKFYVIGAAIQSKLVWLAVVAGLNSAIALYYYFRIVHQMFFVAPHPASSHPLPQGEGRGEGRGLGSGLRSDFGGVGWILGLTAGLVLGLGMFPEALANLVRGPLVWLN